MRFASSAGYSSWSSDFISSAPFKIAALDQYLQFNLKDKPAGYLGSVLVGITFAVAWTPCVGPILGATLALASTSGEVGRGTFLLMSYAAGLGLPFFLSALAINSFFQFSQKLSPLYPSDSCGRRHSLDHRRHPVDHRLHDLLNAYALRFTPTGCCSGSSSYVCLTRPG